MILKEIPISIVNPAAMNEEVHKIIDYIHTCYSNSMLTIDDAAEDLGISAEEITLLLADSLKTTFKKYLMVVRLDERRKLIQETGLSLREINRKVGLPVVARG